MGVRGSARLTLGKRVSSNPAEIGKREKKWRRTHSGHDEGGSAANRVRRLLLSIFEERKKVNQDVCHVTFLPFFLPGE
jgi:hypothetical protein